MQQLSIYFGTKFFVPKVLEQNWIHRAQFSIIVQQDILGFLSGHFQNYQSYIQPGACLLTVLTDNVR